MYCASFFLSTGLKSSSSRLGLAPIFKER
jgi:hypothetical protein